MSNLKNILRRAIKNGFDLSYIPNYRPRTFRNGLYDYLVESKFYCYMEEERIFVGVNILDDIAEVYLEDSTMKVVPLSEVGFFDLLVHLFKYIGIASKEKPEEEETTESLDDDSSEEIWL
jgi:hypothetical protein